MIWMPLPPKAYSKANQKSQMQLFMKIVKRFTRVSYFIKKLLLKCLNGFWIRLYFTISSLLLSSFHNLEECETRFQQGFVLVNMSLYFRLHFLICLSVFLFSIPNWNTYKNHVGKTLEQRKGDLLFLLFCYKDWKIQVWEIIILLGFKSCTLISLIYFLKVREGHWNKVKTNRIAYFVICLETKIKSSIFSSLFVLISVYDDEQLYLMVHFFTPSYNRMNSLHKTQFITVNVCWTFIKQQILNSLGVM